MDRRNNLKTKRVPKKTYGRDYEWEDRIKKERQAANNYDVRWGFMKEKQSINTKEPELTDKESKSLYPVNLSKKNTSTKIGDKEYDLSRLYPLKKNKGNDVNISTHNFNDIETKPKMESISDRSICNNSSRLRYQFKIKPDLPQESYSYPVTGNMEYGWNWTGRNIDRMFGSLSCNNVQMATNRWKMEKKS